MIVRGAPSPRPIRDPSLTVTEWDRERVESAGALGLEIADLADMAAGARVIDLGGPGHDRRLSVRGGSPAQSLVVVDGVPLRSPFATGLDASAIGIDGVERVAVVRGGAGALLGEGALGGALLISTKRARGRSSRAALSFGSFETLGVRAAHTREPISLAVDFQQTAGGFDYVSRLAGLPDSIEHRDNNDARRGGAAIRIDQQAFGGSLFGLAAGSYRAAGVPGLETQANLDAREARGTGALWLGWRRPGEGGAFAGSVHASLLSIDYQDARIGAAARTRFAAGGAEIAADRKIAPWLLLAARAEAGGEASDSTIHGSPSRGRAGLGVEARATKDAWTLFGAARLELVGGEAAAVLPRIAIRRQLGEIATLSFGAGRSLRAPALDELYHPEEPGFTGNPKLVAESSWEGEVSLRLSASADVSASVTAFARSIDDAILYVNRDAFVIRPENLGAARAAGAEIEADLAAEILGARTRLELSGGPLWSELEVTGRPIPTAPALGLEAMLTVSLGSEERSAPASLFSRASYASPVSANLQGNLRTDPYLRWDAGLSVRPFAGGALSLWVQNLTDERTLETVHKIPLPGRSVMASVTVSTEEER